MLNKVRVNWIKLDRKNIWRNKILFFKTVNPVVVYNLLKQINEPIVVSETTFILMKAHEKLFAEIIDYECRGKVMSTIVKWITVPTIKGQDTLIFWG